MKKPDNYKIYIGTCLLTLILLMNVYMAFIYYKLDKIELTQFFIWQTNIERSIMAE